MAKLGLVCSSGGHLLQLHSLKPFWEQHDRFWVAYPTPDAESLLQGEKVHWISHTPAREASNLLKDLPLAWRTLRREKPDIVITTGARIAVPFFYLGRLLGCKLIYLETISRIDSPSLAFRLASPAAHVRLVQWPDLAERSGASYKGGVLDLFNRWK